MENRVELIEIDKFEDDGESSKRQDLQLECENGGNLDWNEEDQW